MKNSMKTHRRLLAMAMSLVLCLTLASPAFAANFSDLQDAIDGVTANDSSDQYANGTALEGGRYGYAWNANPEGEQGYWGIQAWDSKDDEGNDVRNVQLYEDVIHGGTGDSPTITIDTSDGDDLILDLNTNKIDGNMSNSKPGAQQVITVAGGKSTIQNGTITGSLGSGVFTHTAYNAEKNDIDLTLDNVEITGNSGRGVSFMSYADTENHFTMIDGNVHDNGSTGVLLQAFTFTMEDSTITGNGTDEAAGNGTGLQLGGGSSGNISNTEISGNAGRGVFMASNTTATFDGVSIHDNAGGVLMAGELTLKNSSIIDNCAPENVPESTWWQNAEGGGIWVKAERKLNLEEGNEIHGNTSNGGTKKSDIYADAGAAISGLDKTPAAPDGKQFDGWYAENGDGDKYEGPAEITEILDLVGSLSDISPVVDPPEADDPIIEINIPDVSLGGGSDETEINDTAVPLASGPVTRAQFLDYLWRHEGEPESDGVCTFEDVPADHEYILALAWAEQNGVAVADEDGTFEPDELVTVGAVREFLGSFAEIFGTNAVAVAELTTLTGEDGEAVLNCDQVLAEFFGEEYVLPDTAAGEDELDTAA